MTTPDFNSARRFDQNLARSGGRIAYRVEEPVPACWFCNRTDRQKSKEHVFPQWLLEHLDIRGATISPVRYTAKGELASERGSFPLANLVCGEICRSCNNGWMSSIEGQTKTILTKDTAVGPLTADELRVLAWWFIKTAIVLNVSQPYRLLVDAETRHAVATGDLDRFFVALFRVSEHDGEVNWVQGTTAGFLVPSDVPDEATVRLSELTLITHIRVGDLVGQVILLPEPLDPSMVDTAPGKSLVIWPSQLPAADWSDLPVQDSTISVFATVNALALEADDLRRAAPTTVSGLSNTVAAADGSREKAVRRSVDITPKHLLFLQFYNDRIASSERQWTLTEIATALGLTYGTTFEVVHDATEMGMVDSTCCQQGSPVLVW